MEPSQDLLPSGTSQAPPSELEQTRINCHPPADGEDDDLHDELQELWNRNKDRFKIDEDAWMRMPAFMDHITEEDAVNNPDIAALQSVLYDETTPLELATRMKENGNNNMIMAQKTGNAYLYTTAIEFYTEGLSQKVEDNTLNGILFSNRAQAHLYRENYASALRDAQRALLLMPTHTKSYFRAITAAIHVPKLSLARELLEHVDKNPDRFPEIQGASSPEWEALRDKLCKEHDAHRKKAALIKNRNQEKKIRYEGARELFEQKLRIRIGPAELQSHHWAEYDCSSFIETLCETLNAAIVSEISVEEVELMFPLLLLYDEYNQSDFIQSVSWFCTIQEQLDEIFPASDGCATREGGSPEFPCWDEHRRYRCDALCVYYRDGAMVRVDPKWTLQELFRHEKYQMPAMLPTLHVVPKGSHYNREWAL